MLSLLLAIMIGSSLTLAWLRPELTALGAAHQRLVVIVDNAASMAARTRDGATRWQHALADARATIQAAPASSEVLLLDTTGRVPLAGFVPVARALELLNAISLSPEPAGRVPPLPTGASITRAYLFTDGVGIDAMPAGVVVRSVFEPAGNVGITTFEGRALPSDPTRYQVFLRIENAAAAPAPVNLEVSGANGFRIERRIEVRADPVNVTLDVSGYEQGPLRAVVRAPGDAFDLDNTAYWVVPQHRMRRVLLITDGNDALADSLRSLPGVALSVRRPVQFWEPTAFDAYVFDRYAPPQAPQAGALLFAPPAVAWLAARWREEAAAAVAGWDATNPLTAGVTWPDLRLGKAWLATSDAASSAVTAGGASGNGALVLAGRARHRWVAAGIDLRDSNFRLQPGFPVFLGNALEWLAERAPIASEGLGRIEVPIANAQVQEANAGAVAATATAEGTLFQAARPGIYLVANPREQRIVVANAIDPRTARINDTRLSQTERDLERSPAPRGSWPEPWVALLALAFILLALEWPAFASRITE